LWLTVDIGIGVLISGAILLARAPRTQKHFRWWLPLVLAAIVALLVVTGLIAHDADLGRHQMFLALMIVVIGTLAMRLPVLSGAAACLLGALGFIALPQAVNAHFAANFAIYYGMQVVVSVFVAALQEYKDRVSFLQSVLLEYKTSEVQRLNFELDRLARLDALSGLSNRRNFDESLTKEWARACRDRSSLALIMLDVDHFKAYNDTYGHPAGDICLTQIGGVLARAMKRPADLAARYGGEEFIVMLPGADANGAEEVAKRIIAGIDALSLEHSASSAASHVTASLGVAVCHPLPGMAAQKLVDAADAALYEAKRGGRHRTVLRPVAIPAGMEAPVAAQQTPPQSALDDGLTV
jgi:diguanylate cyclase (GGDEF)-like protein